MSPDYTPLNDEIRNRIHREVGASCVRSPEEDISDYARDGSELEHFPELVVYTETTHQVQRLLQLANELRFPVTPRGAGTGLAGGCLPVLGGVVLSLERMKRIQVIDPLNLIAQVEPGVMTKDLRDAARAQGLLYPPDPAGMEVSTVGGNAGTNAGGPACLKYGTTRDYVLGLEVVLPAGDVIRTGVQTRKGVVGYDLTHLLVGSEGTLAVITGLTLKLIPHPPAVAGLCAIFPGLHTAMETVANIMSSGHLPSAIEFMDYRCLALVGDLLPFSVDSERAGLLIIEVDGSLEQVRHERESIGEICRKTGATRLLSAADEEERESIWNVRRQISLRIHDTAGLYIPEDVVVPIARIAELVDALPEYEAEYDLLIYAFGHAGDGNIHLNVTAVGREGQGRAEQGVEALLTRVLSMGGTMSGEHGVGVAKMPFLPMELSAENIRLQRGIKGLFDPNHILNPGKIFPPEGGQAG